MKLSVILMGRHTLVQTVVQGYRVTAKVRLKGPSSLKGQRMTHSE